MKTRLINVFSEIITGEWGDEDISGTGVAIIKTTCFLNDGKIDFAKIENRLVRKKIKDEFGRVQYVIDEDKIEKKRLYDGDIIIEKSGGGIGTPVGRVVFFNAPDKKTYLCNNFAQVLRVDKSTTHPKFAFYYLRYLYERGNVLKYQNQTTGIFNLKLERYLQEEIPLLPLDKQLSVITQLDTIQFLLDKRIEKISVLERLNNSIYFNLFGDSVNNEKKYPLKKLSQIVKKDKGITYGIVQAGPHIEDGIPYLRSGDIKNGIITVSDQLRTSKKISEKYSRTICDEGDILLTIRATVGEVGYVSKEFIGYNLTRGIAILSPKKESVNPFYLYHTLLSNGFQFLLERQLKGATFKEISLTKLREIKIPVPDLQLQNEFSTIVKQLIELRAQLERSLSLMKVLFQSVLQNAFKGDIVIDEEPIFKELIKKFTLVDLKGNKKRLQFLINLFDSKVFDDLDDYSDAKEKLFQLIEEDQIIQELTNNNLKLKVK